MVIIPLVITSIQNEEDREFFKELYINHHVVMYRMARRYTDSSFDAEDIVSNAIVYLLGKTSLLRSLDPPALHTYVFLSVRYAGIMYICGKKKLQTVPMDENGENYSDAGREEEPDANILRGCNIEEIRQVLKRLKEADREILTMKYFLHLDDAIIAKELNLKETSVRSRLLRARHHAYEMLKEMNQE